MLAELQSQLCPVPENIHTPPTEGIGISWREVHSLRPKHLKTEMYQGKGVSWIKSLSWGRDGYFQELSVLFSLMNFKIKLKTTKLNISAILTVTIWSIYNITLHCTAVSISVHIQGFRVPFLHRGWFSSLCIEMHFPDKF